MEDTTRALSMRKYTFLNDVQIRISRYIESRGKQCIAVIELSPTGEPLRTWEVHMDDDFGHFCKVLYLFTRKKPYKGHNLDSALTGPISNIVEVAYTDFYRSESDAISKGMLTMLAADEVKLKSFVDRIADIAIGSLGSQVKKHLAHLIMHQLKHSIQHGALHGIGQQVGHVATAAAGSQVAMVVAQLLLRLLAHHIGQIITKLLASSFLKKVLVVLGKKFVIAAVGGAVLHFLAGHVAAAVGGSTLMWIVAPALVVYLGYKIATFPEKLGQEVGKSVREELDKNFEQTNVDMLTKIFEKVFSDSDLVNAIAKDEEFQQILKQIGENGKLEGVAHTEEKKISNALVTVEEVYVSNDEHTCGKCFKTFYSATSLQSHCDMWHATSVQKDVSAQVKTDSKHTCKTCSKKFYSATSLQSHCDALHATQTQKDGSAQAKSKSEHTCETCFRTFYSANSLLSHRDLWHSTSVTKKVSSTDVEWKSLEAFQSTDYSCNKCFRTFFSSNSLQSHQDLWH